MTTQTLHTYVAVTYMYNKKCHLLLNLLNEPTGLSHHSQAVSTSQFQKASWYLPWQET